MSSDNVSAAMATALRDIDNASLPGRQQDGAISAKVLSARGRSEKCRVRQRIAVVRSFITAARLYIRGRARPCVRAC